MLVELSNNKLLRPEGRLYSTNNNKKNNDVTNFCNYCYLVNIAIFV